MLYYNVKYSIFANQKGGIAQETSVPKVPKDKKVKKEIVHQLPHCPKVTQNVLIALIRNIIKLIEWA